MRIGFLDSRTGNQTLTNGETRHFSKSLEIKVDLDKLKFGVLDRLLRVGDKRSERRRTPAGKKGSAGKATS